MEKLIVIINTYKDIFYIGILILIVFGFMHYMSQIARSIVKIEKDIHNLAELKTNDIHQIQIANAIVKIEQDIHSLVENKDNENQFE